MHTSRLLPTRVTTYLHRIGLDQRGVAAVEFALILPIMVFVFLGLAELQPAISAKRKVSLVVGTVADLASRMPANSSGVATLSGAELKLIFGAATAIMRPYDDTKTQMVVTSVSVTPKGTGYEGKVLWSCPWNLGAEADDLKKKTAGTLFDVPDAFQDANTVSFLHVEVLYPYKPTLGYTIAGIRKLKDSVSWPVIDAKSVAQTGCPTQP